MIRITSLFFHRREGPSTFFTIINLRNGERDFPLDESEENIPIQEEEAEIEEPKVLARWANADPMVEAQNWWSSPWFGEFT